MTDALAALLHADLCMVAGTGTHAVEGWCVRLAARLSAAGVRVAAPRSDEVEALRDALEGMARQHSYWSDTVGGIHTGGLSSLEDAFEALGWEDPQPLPDRRCDEPGCMKEGAMGWPTRPGGTGPNGGYRRTCWDHDGRAAALELR